MNDADNKEHRESSAPENAEPREDHSPETTESSADVEKLQDGCSPPPSGQEEEARSSDTADTTRQVASTDEENVSEPKDGGQAGKDTAVPEKGMLPAADEPQDDDTVCATENDDAEEASEPGIAAVATAAVITAGAAGSDDEDDEEEDDDDEEEEGMSLRDHLRELRKRLFYAILWAFLGFLPCYYFGKELFFLLKKPLIDVLPAGSDIIFTGLPDGFFTQLKVGILAGLFLASPMIFYQVWAFIAPGLYKEEKHFILPIAFFSALFFIAGGAFCYFVTFPFAFDFFLTYNDEHMKAMLSATEYLSFSLQLLFAFGLVFELPLFTFFFARIGLVTADWMRRMRRYAILVIVIVAAILTPPDVISQMLMSLPMLVLYEFSIWVAAAFGRKKAGPEEEEEEEEEEDTDAPAPADNKEA